MSSSAVVQYCRYVALVLYQGCVVAPAMMLLHCIIAKVLAYFYKVFTSCSDNTVSQVVSYNLLQTVNRCCHAGGKVVRQHHVCMPY